MGGGGGSCVPGGEESEGVVRLGVGGPLGRGIVRSVGCGRVSVLWEGMEVSVRRVERGDV